MTEKEVNKYRLTSLEEPTDEMLSYIMKEIAAEVKAKNEAIDRCFMDNLRVKVQKNKVMREEVGCPLM